jgi:hypothetical protein
MAAVAISLPICVLASSCGGSEDSPRAAAGGPAPSAERAAILNGLSHRLVPAAGGGWVAAEVSGPPQVETWLHGAAIVAEAGDAAPAVEALGRGASAVDRAGRERGPALAVAALLALGHGGPAAPRVAADVLVRAERAIEQGQGDWLGVLVTLSYRPSPVAEEAGAALRAVAGEAACSSLPAAGDAPDPQGAVLVPARLLVLQGLTCERASDVLRAVESDAAWGSPLGAGELADLAALVPEGQARERAVEGLRERFDRWTIDAGGGSNGSQDDPVSLSTIVHLRAAAREIGVAGAIPAPLRARSAGQVAARGRLPDRSTSPPTLFDVALQRLLVGGGRTNPAVLASTVMSVDVEALGPTSGVAARGAIDLLAGAEPVRCADGGLDGVEGSGRPTPIGLVGSAAQEAACSRASVSELLRSGDPGAGAFVAVLRSWSILLQRCATQGAAAMRGVDPPVVGPGLGELRRDPTVQLARAWALDPVASCKELSRVP